MTVPRPLLLVILDGWGAGESCDGNAVALARTPVMDRLLSEYPHTTLGASGPDVGLPPGQMGNSEVGHLNIGAGRKVLQDFQRIRQSLAEGDFYSNEALNLAIAHSLEHRSTLHLLGLLSSGGVHSHIEHLFALLEMARSEGLVRVVTHAILDGRDVPPKSALEWVWELEHRTADGVGSIRTIEGRYYAMDRDNRWDRTALAYDAIVRAKGPRAASGAEVVTRSYEEDIDDEFVVPSVVGARIPMKGTDAVIFFNFRPDRPRQLTRALIDPEFREFDRGPQPPLPYLVTMTEYDPRFGVPVAFRPEAVTNVLGDVLANNGKTQLRIAETEKYAHVTYFFSGGVEAPAEGEDRVLIPSPGVATYDLKPEMSAPEVAQEARRRILSGTYDFIVLNFANGDMVGHTGSLEATIRAVEAVDSALGLVLEALAEVGGTAFVTADHGNADDMGSENDPCTAHSLSRVPFVNVTPEKRPLRSGGTLVDIAPTVLELMGLPKPPQMTGRSLFVPVAKTAAHD